MICPKCGRDIDGNSCPYCDEIEINDKTSEYAKIKSAYLQSQKEAQEREDAQKEAEMKGEKAAAFAKKHYKGLIIAGAVAAGAITALCVIIPKMLMPKYNSALYYMQNNHIWRVDKNNASDLGESERYALSSQKTNIYDLTVPSAIPFNDKSKRLQTMSDKTGNYYIISFYDSDDRNKCLLYLWDKDGNSVKIIETDKLIDVKNVLSNGNVVFSMSDIVNEELYFGSKSLNIFSVDKTDGKEIKGTVVSLSKSVDNIGTFTTIDDIIYDESSGSSGEGKIYIRNCADINSGSYVKGNDFSCAPGGTFFYRSNGAWREKSLITGEEKVLGADDDNNFSFLSNDKYVFLENEDVFVFEDGKGNIIKTVDDDYGVWQKVKDNVTSHSLKKVKNSGGYVFISDNNLYFAGNSSEHPKEIIKLNSDSVSLREAALVGKTLFFVDEKRNLHAVSTDGNEYTDLGKCEDIWVGDT